METNVQTMTMGAAINQCLRHALETDPDVILLGEDIAEPAGGVMKITSGLSDEFGEQRVRDTPISECAIMGAAAGAAIAGMRPVAEIMINDFIAIGMDQLVNLAAKHHYTSNGAVPVPLTVRTGVASRLGTGATHSQSLEAWLMHVPGLKVAFPSNAYDAKGILATCINDDDPCVFFEDYTLYALKGEVPLEDYRIPLGKAKIVRSGKDLTVITYGWPVHACQEAAAQLADEGIEAELVDLRWLLPLDYETILESVGRTRRAIVVHAATRFCGPGAEIAATIQQELFDVLAAPVGRVAAPFTPAPAAPAMEALYFPSVAKIVEEARRTCTTTGRGNRSTEEMAADARE